MYVCLKNDSTHMRSQASSVGTPSAHQLNAIQMMFCCRAYGCLYWNGQYENLMRYMFSIAGGFAPAAKTGVVTDHDIDEASGCAVSRLNRNVLYTLNDHGGKNRVYAVNINGTLVGELTIDGATNVDWEDLAIGPCDNTDSFSSCIYIGKSHR